MPPLLPWPTLLSHGILIRWVFNTPTQFHLKGICLLFHVLQNWAAKEEQQNRRRERGVVWEIDDSTKFTLAVIPKPVINCKDKLTPKPLGSHILSSMGPNQRLWKWINLLSMTLMIFKWPWHNFFFFPSFLLYFPSAAKFYGLKYAVNYGNQLQKSNSWSVCIMFCQKICLCKPASEQEFRSAEIKLRGNRKELPLEM